MEILILNFRIPTGLRYEQRGNAGFCTWVHPPAHPTPHPGRGQPTAPAAAGQAAGACEGAETTRQQELTLLGLI